MLALDVVVESAGGSLYISNGVRFFVNHQLLALLFLSLIDMPPLGEELHALRSGNVRHILNAVEENLFLLSEDRLLIARVGVCLELHAYLLCVCYVRKCRAEVAISI